MDRPDGATRSTLSGIVTGPRPGRMRSRRGRGQRGPMSLPGPLSPRGVPAHRSTRAAFDALVESVLAALDHHFRVESDQVELVVEEAPLLPPEWTDDVPLSIVVATPTATRIVLFRLPITHRCHSTADLEDLLWTVILDRLAEVWRLPPDDLDPRPR